MRVDVFGQAIWLGFGKETASASAEPITRFYPFIPSGHEHCGRCGAIKPRSRMLLADIDERGDVWRCIICDGPSAPAHELQEAVDGLKRALLETRAAKILEAALEAALRWLSRRLAR